MVKRSSALQPGIGVVGSASPLPTRNKRNRNLNVKPSDEKASFEDGGDASLRLNVVTPPPKPGKRSRRGRVPEDIGIPKLVCA